MNRIGILGTLVLASASAGLAENEAYLFASFRGNGEDGLHLAHSRDGLTWTALNGDKSFLKPEVGGKLMRDPCIIRGPDGLFHMVWTTSWSDQGIGYAHSKDLMTWSEQQFVPVMAHEAGARNCWAPEITWDPDGGQYVIYWATTLPDRFTETAKGQDKGWNHRIYCTTTKDFQNYTPTRLFYDPGFNVIDSTIVRDGDSWVMISKDETRHPPAKNLHLARSSKVSGPWRKVSGPFTPKGLWVEGATAIKIGDFWHVYYDCYTEHRYGAMRTRDFKNWENVSDQLVVPKGMRHGTAFVANREVLAGLPALVPRIPEKLPNASFEILGEAGGQPMPEGWETKVYAGDAEFASSEFGRGGSRCIRISSSKGTDASWQTTVAVKPRSRYKLSGWIQTKDLAAGSGRGALFNIHELSAAATEAVTGTSDWSKLEVVFDTGGLRQLTVNALFGGWGTSSGSALYDDLKLERLGDIPAASTWPAPSGNPIIADCIADPSIAEFDGVFYLTATTDDCPREGFGRWHNGPAVVWKSTDLVNWSFDGHLMPETNHLLYWAPSRIIRHGGRYLLFPTLDHKIRVAASKSPDGPFRLIAGTDKTPLFDTIDAEVFVDDDGRGYLFSNQRRAWRMNGALTALVGDPVTIPTNRGGYSEGPIVFKRKDIYYYLYTLAGHQDYHYAYCMSRESPLGPFETPAEDVILRSDPEAGIFGPGHGNVFSPEGSDDFYFVYLEYGRGGVTRQVCIDRMEFHPDGRIKPVKPSTAGIRPLKRGKDHQGKRQLKGVVASASSCREEREITAWGDKSRVLRRENFLARNALDHSNFTRWLPRQDDADPWLVVDLGQVRAIRRIELFLSRPTLGHAYRLEASRDGQRWDPVVDHPEPRICSPQADQVETTARFLRLQFLQGHPGVWEVRVFGNEDKSHHRRNFDYSPADSGSSSPLNTSTTCSTNRKFGNW